MEVLYIFVYVVTYIQWLLDQEKCRVGLRQGKASLQYSIKKIRIVRLISRWLLGILVKTYEM